MIVCEDVSMRRIVLPGEKIANRELRIENTFIEGGATYAAVVGLLDDDGTYIPLELRYKPAVKDVIVGIVTEVKPIGYNVDINIPYRGFISSQAIRTPLNIGDIVVAKINFVDELGNVELVEARKLPQGKIVDFPPAKVPRLIGKKGSMLNILKEASGGGIVIGNNGYVWLSEDCNIPLLLKAMKIIMQKAHLSGLTDEVSQLLEKEKKKGGFYGRRGGKKIDS
jgi:exosome complex component RRP4